MSNVVENLKKKLYFKRTEMLFDKAVMEGKITECDQEI